MPRQGTSEGFEIEGLEPPFGQRRRARPRYQGPHFPGLEQHQMPGAVHEPAPTEEGRQVTESDAALAPFRPGPQRNDTRLVGCVHGAPHPELLARIEPVERR